MLIGLAGRAGAGKDTVAGIIREEAALTGQRTAVASFADPLYRAISTIAGIPVSMLRDRGFKEETIDWLGKSPRQLLQTLGTEWGRGLVHPDIWVRAAMREAKARRDIGVGTIFADLRFDNEAAAIRETGGRVFRVIRPGYECLAADAATHPSEAGIRDDLVDAIVINDGDLVQLRERVVGAIMQ